MAVVLVTGGTGMLGRRLVPQLAAAGHEVRVLSRRTRTGTDGGIRGFRGDVLTGDGVTEAAAGTDVVIHAASNPRRRERETEARST